MPPEQARIQPVRYRPPDARDAKGPNIRLLPALLLGAAVLAAAILAFLFTARSVELRFQPAAARVELDGGPALAFQGVHLLLRGEYQVRAEADGHYPIETRIEVGSERNQAFEFRFAPLPGLIDIVAAPPGAQVAVDGRPLGKAPLAEIPIEAGRRRFRFTHPRHRPLELQVQVEGRRQPQTVQARLPPNWGRIGFATQPPGAAIFVDAADTGLRTPAVAEILAGERDILLALKGHKNHRQRLLVTAEEERSLPPVQLQKADALLTVHTRPAGAGLTLDGQYQGETPASIALQSGRTYRLQAFKGGYAARSAAFSLQPGERRQLNWPLTELTGTLAVAAEPPEAELFIDGRSMGAATQTLELPARPHRLEIRLAGHAGYSKEILPRSGLTQEVRVKLLTLEEARLAALRPEIATAQGQRMKLFRPGPIRLGASRREPGRRANETLREVALSRLFYLALEEVTNAQFKAFASGHDSGEYEAQRLNKDDQPAVRLGWHEAALYCNWLSKQDGLPPFYLEDLGKATGFRPEATGYRLPTEAEWAWAARHRQGESDLLRFPWGAALPPPNRHGNYADRAAAHLVGRIIFNYNDNHAVSAPVGSFPANAKGIHDLGGNVSEWTHDFYQHPAAADLGPLGPGEGEYHVIRGSSWMHGTVTDLRLSFRDYGIDGRQDLGFRIARFAE